MKCYLAHDINHCPYYIKDTGTCNKNDTCSFQKQVDSPNKEYVRTERWYEKYYKKK